MTPEDPFHSGWIASLILGIGLIFTRRSAAKYDKLHERVTELEKESATHGDVDKRDMRLERKMDSQFRDITTRLDKIFERISK